MNTWIMPPRFIVPPITVLLASLGTGSDSPVSMDSSTWDDPAYTSPSAGTLAPGRTYMRHTLLCLSSVKTVGGRVGGVEGGV